MRREVARRERHRRAARPDAAFDRSPRPSVRFGSRPERLLPPSGRETPLGASLVTISTEAQLRSLPLPLVAPGERVCGRGSVLRKANARVRGDLPPRVPRRADQI